ncbi:hypothetical protein SAMN05421820_11445 [Pedobacter steynii]|uniref:Uncharacterized protein n=1 Tax=Pedobacter steynii TaxID=430522 RepID=A0A1H0J0K2_9SPHI|nr:hypothetical protein [Pedobacter steynii]NQX42996.1 hypothetical protein [Pedobacter steynii]SDO37236.1 hypothetical protein SAMN05421820_11445 [Pedobacter steynii]
MKKTLQIILLLNISFFTLFAQNTKRISKKKKAYKTNTLADWEKNYKKEFSDCGFTNKYTAKQRLAMYPFSKAAKVLAVSYKYGGIDTDETNDLKNFPRRGLRINNGILDTTTLIETKKLKPEQTDELTRLFFNTDYKNKSELHLIEFAKCFEPRNALIFLNSDDKVIDYLEICFECKQNYSKSELFDIGILCNQKYELFSHYFKSIGVSYGTTGRDYREEDRKDWEELRKLR